MNKIKTWEPLSISCIVFTCRHFGSEMVYSISERQGHERYQNKVQYINTNILITKTREMLICMFWYYLHTQYTCWKDIYLF